MAWTFSKRCKKALDSKKIKVSIPRATRARIWMALQDFNETYVETQTPAAPYYRTFLNDLTDKLKEELGIEQLTAFPASGDGPAEASDIEGFIMRGN